jgi:adenylyltransferase/sulfurtransferase
MPELDAARYARQLVLPGFGALGQRRLGGARILVVGAGGLGSSVIPILASSGVGTIGVIDDDTVEISNLPRQTIHRPASVGRPKAESAADAIAEINPAVRVEARRERLTAENALGLFGAYDLVVDGSDNFATRYLTDDAATITTIPCVWGAVHRFNGQAGLSWSSHGPTYRDLFPSPPPPGTVGSCEEDGVLPTVCSVIGGIMASEVVKLLTGIGEPLLGRVATYDARTGDMRMIEYGRDPSSQPIRSLIDYDDFCATAGHRQEEEHRGEEETEGRPRLGAADDMAFQVNDATGAESGSQSGDPLAITVTELADALAQGQPVQLLDVREEWEASIAQLPDSKLIPLAELPYRAGELDSDAVTVVYCHAGSRSDRAVQILSSLDFTRTRSLRGGIDEWSRVIDPSVARY